jgi:hypothetical protein
MQINGKSMETPRRPVNPADSLCLETKGREIMAALVSEAVDEALGLSAGLYRTETDDATSSNRSGRGKRLNG